jgi:hypothetical protein
MDRMDKTHIPILEHCTRRTCATMCKEAHIRMYITYTILTYFSYGKDYTKTCDGHEALNT